jgi:cold shock CspA family protein
MRYKGEVVSFNSAKVFGFVFCPDLHRRVFFHVTEVNGINPSIGDKVEFELGPSRTPGKPEVAVKIEYVLVAPSVSDLLTDKVGA